MAGRILPIALATVAGVSIGVATFGREFEEQRKRKLEEEYQKEVATISSTKSAPVSSLPSAGPSPMTSSAIPAPSPAQLAAQKTEGVASQSSWSSMLGLWAWKESNKSATDTHDEKVNGKP